MPFIAKPAAMHNRRPAMHGGPPPAPCRASHCPPRALAEVPRRAQRIAPCCGTACLSSVLASLARSSTPPPVEPQVAPPAARRQRLGPCFSDLQPRRAWPAATVRHRRPHDGNWHANHRDLVERPGVPDAVGPHPGTAAAPKLHGPQAARTAPRRPRPRPPMAQTPPGTNPAPAARLAWRKPLPTLPGAADHRTATSTPTTAIWLSGLGCPTPSAHTLAQLQRLNCTAKQLHGRLARRPPGRPHASGRHDKLDHRLYGPRSDLRAAPHDAGRRGEHGHNSTAHAATTGRPSRCKPSRRARLAALRAARRPPGLLHSQYNAGRNGELGLARAATSVPPLTTQVITASSAGSSAARATTFGAPLKMQSRHGELAAAPRPARRLPGRHPHAAF